MNQPNKGMSSEMASMKKIAGHVNEYDYAELIDGQVNAAGYTRKKDVIDALGRTHSVKSGRKWQMFLYAKSRLETNTVLRGIGNVSNLMIDCIDSLPALRKDREENSRKYKIALQKPMTNLCNELQNENILQAFLMKVFFEAGEVEFLSILPSDIDQIKATPSDKHFHLFDAQECVLTLCDRIRVANSRKRNHTQMDAQKVVFIKNNVQFGEIELRTDSSNWGRMKMWLQSDRVLPILQNNIGNNNSPRKGLTTYGKATKAFIVS